MLCFRCLEEHCKLCKGLIDLAVLPASWHFWKLDVLCACLYILNKIGVLLISTHLCNVYFALDLAVLVRPLEND